MCSFAELPFLAPFWKLSIRNIRALLSTIRKIFCKISWVFGQPRRQTRTFFIQKHPFHIQKNPTKMWELTDVVRDNYPHKPKNHPITHFRPQNTTKPENPKPKNQHPLISKTKPIWDWHKKPTTTPTKTHGPEHVTHIPHQNKPPNTKYMPKKQ